jgi:exopolysaccharide biosynthesis polyprenyl glycosylphosphotransferase
VSNVEMSVDDRTWRRDGVSLPVPSRLQQLLPRAWAGFVTAADVLLVLGAFLLAHWLRFTAPDAPDPAFELGPYARIGLGVGLVTALLFAHHGLYDGDRPQSWPARIYTVISVLSTALVTTVLVSYFLGEDRFSRLWFLTGWALAVAILAIWRGFAQSLYTAIRDAVSPATRVLIVGANTLGQELARELSDRYEVLGYVDNGSDLNGSAEYPLLGPIARLDQLVHGLAVDELIIALPSNRRDQASAVIARGFHRRVAVKFLPDMGELLPQRFELHHHGGRPYIGFAAAAQVSWLKRAVDLVLGTMALVVLSPLFIAIAVAIKLSSAGPVFYRQCRVGKHGKHFSMFKFRSMHQDAEGLIDQLRSANEATGPLFKIRSDPRVTQVGRLLRRLSLDELPQLFNVIRGEMSLVGPRPPIPSEVEQYDDWQLGRLRAVPGMTGLWQVSGRSEVPFYDMVRLDLHYIRNWTLGLDFEILLRTIPAVLTNRGAY